MARLSTVVAYPPDPPINRLTRFLHLPGARQFSVTCVDTVGLSCMETFLKTGTPWTQEAIDSSWRSAKTGGYLPQSGDLAPLIEISQEVAPRGSFYPRLVITQIQIYIDDHFIAAVRNHVQISTFQY